MTAGQVVGSTRSWRRAGVSDDQWSARRTELTGLVSSVVHIAYLHGAIRQIVRSARGPKE